MQRSKKKMLYFFKRLPVVRFGRGDTNFHEISSLPGIKEKLLCLTQQPALRNNRVFAKRPTLIGYELGRKTS